MRVKKLKDGNMVPHPHGIDIGISVTNINAEIGIIRLRHQNYYGQFSCMT
jgi:hypothetical protein